MYLVTYADWTGYFGSGLKQVIQSETKIYMYSVSQKIPPQGT